jgi:palmitoyl-protein thioesterase
LGFRFDDDITVVPKISEFFGSFAEGNLSALVPYNQQPLYTEDWIGLRTLDETGRVFFQVQYSSVIQS